MSEFRVPTNDEIVDELTKDLEKHCTPMEENPTSSNADLENILETESKIDDLKRVDGDVDDYIDEEALEKEESTLTERQLDERHAQAMELKEKGNKEFRDNMHIESIVTYTQGLRVCPLKHVADRAILYCNRSAAKIKLKRVESAICDCSKSIELNPTYIRAIHRRATLYEETEKLNEALDDYKRLLELDPKNADAQSAIHRLPPKIAEMNEKLKEEMMGKLKDLGNLFLKPFGLSTNNFKMQQDPKTGGYSVNFQQ